MRSHKEAIHQSNGQHNCPSTRPRGRPGRGVSICRCISFEDHARLSKSVSKVGRQDHMSAKSEAHVKTRSARAQRIVDDNFI